ncbi:MAG: hypothetical protein ABFD83_09210 [Armatimonadota bacterium]
MQKYIRVALFCVILCGVLAVGVWATDLWVLQFSDTHYTAYNPANGTSACVQAMNVMPGTTWNYVGGRTLSVRLFTV